jgi:hypothetical protein
MAELNIVSILYISFRLAPFILVSFFSLSSIFNQDFKGLIYLAGLLITCFITILSGNLAPDEMTGNLNDNKICNLITLSSEGPFSKLPLSQTVFGYTFFYLVYIIVKYNLVSENIPTLVIFPILIVADFIWNSMHQCSPPITIIASLLIGGTCGLLWSYIIDTTQMVNLQYFNGLSNNEVCTRPTKTTFKCKAYKNGKLLVK